MKKVLALIMALVMVLALTACKSKEQKAADNFIKEMDTLVDEAIVAFQDQDLERLQSLQDEIKELRSGYNDILADLRATDEEAAAEFEEEIIKIGEKMVAGMS